MKPRIGACRLLIFANTALRACKSRPWNCTRANKIANWRVLYKDTCPLAVYIQVKQNKQKGRGYCQLVLSTYYQSLLMIFNSLAYCGDEISALKNSCKLLTRSYVQHGPPSIWHDRSKSSIIRHSLKFAILDGIWVVNWSQLPAQLHQPNYTSLKI